ncbi:MAG: haloalkane dehalogenase [Gammaproteobacteria bacterium]
MTINKISADFPYESHFVDVLGSKMHYIEEGKGDPILFLHGIPASSYVWRNIIPHLSKLGRCIAPDLIGMGKSAKPDIEYSIFDHIKYIDTFIEVLNLKRITLIMHGWGSVIGFDYATKNENQCKGLVFYEAYLRPFNDDDFSLPLQEHLHTIDQQENIYDLVMNGTYYIDKVLPQEMLHTLNQEEMSHYREPFLLEGSGKPIRQYLKELPRNARDTKVDQLIATYSKKLTQSKLPKLMLYSVPGYITTIASAMWAKQNLPNLEIVDVGEELHYAQESDPVLMGESISIWLQGQEQKV